MAVPIAEAGLHLKPARHLTDETRSSISHPGWDHTPAGTVLSLSGGP